MHWVANRPRHRQLKGLVRFLGADETDIPKFGVVNQNNLPLFPLLQRHAKFSNA
jgi:hypothetical protein